MKNVNGNKLIKLCKDGYEVLHSFDENGESSCEEIERVANSIAGKFVGDTKEERLYCVKFEDGKIIELEFEVFAPINIPAEKREENDGLDWDWSINTPFHGALEGIQKIVNGKDWCDIYYGRYGEDNPFYMDNKCNEGRSIADIKKDMLKSQNNVNDLKNEYCSALDKNKAYIEYLESKKDLEIKLNEIETDMDWINKLIELEEEGIDTKHEIYHACKETSCDSEEECGACRFDVYNVINNIHEETRVKKYKESRFDALPF